MLAVTGSKHGNSIYLAFVFFFYLGSSFGFNFGLE